MEHLAIDLGSTESQVCVRDELGTIIEQKRIRTQRIEGYLAKRPPSRVILETSAEAFHVADVARSKGHEVCVVPSVLVRTLGVGARGVKNDVRDAQVLSDVSCKVSLPSVHIPSIEARDRKALCGSREALVATRTMLINRVRGWMRTQTWTLRGRSPTTFPGKVRAKLEAEGSIPAHIALVLDSIEHLNTALHEANRQLEDLAHGDERCRRLMTVPGVGPVTAIRFAAALDDVQRFDDAHAVQSYLGLVPGERSSGKCRRFTGITKAGPPEVRRALVQAAWSALNARTRRGDPMVVWARRIAARSGTMVAAVALARKLAGILFAIWRDGTSYDPTRAACKVEENKIKA